MQEKDKYVMRFDRGEEVIEELKNFCRAREVGTGFFYGLGAAQQVELSWYDVDEKRYQSKAIKEKLEIISLLGNIAKMQEKTIIHAHACFSNSQMQTQAGHIKKIEVAATCEIFLKALGSKIEREHSPQIGLNLMSP